MGGTERGRGAVTGGPCVNRTPAEPTTPPGQVDVIAAVLGQHGFRHLRACSDDVTARQWCWSCYCGTESVMAYGCTYRDGIAGHARHVAEQIDGALGAAGKAEAVELPFVLQGDHHDRTLRVEVKKALIGDGAIRLRLVNHRVGLGRNLSLDEARQVRDALDSALIAAVGDS
jgi:hypothetical protein